MRREAILGIIGAAVLLGAVASLGLNIQDVYAPKSSKPKEIVVVGSKVKESIRSPLSGATCLVDDIADGEFQRDEVIAEGVTNNGGVARIEIPEDTNEVSMVDITCIDEEGESATVGPVMLKENGVTNVKLVIGEKDEVNRKSVATFCPPATVQHWDKIHFNLTMTGRIPGGPDFVAIFEDLDIKVRDDPTKLADLNAKIIRFLQTDPVIEPEELTDNNEPKRLSDFVPAGVAFPGDVDFIINIKDVEYAIVCTIPVLEPAPGNLPPLPP